MTKSQYSRLIPLAAAISSLTYFDFFTLQHTSIEIITPEMPRVNDKEATTIELVKDYLFFYIVLSFYECY